MSLPDRMKVVAISAPGGPEVLQLAEVPEPELTGERDVKIRLAGPASIR